MRKLCLLQDLQLIKYVQIQKPAFSNIGWKPLRHFSASTTRTMPNPHTTQLPATVKSESYNNKGVSESGNAILANPYTNQQTAFTDEARNKLKLRGLMPSAVETIDTQVTRCMHNLERIENEIDKFMYLNTLKHTNTTLFYRLAVEHSAEILPIIYTPTIGAVCLKWSELLMQSEGLYISINDVDNLDEILSHYLANKVDITVVTDGSRILGLGDIGLNGMGIPIGKLSLYSALGGIRPERTAPICLDLGTNNEALLKDPLYLGLKRKRVSQEEFIAFMDKFMEALYRRWPTIVTQFEDFSTDSAFNTLERYRTKYPMFNDDIQGTGAVILSGFINAAKITDYIKPSEHRLLFFGAGSAGVGVAKQIMSYFHINHVSEEDARSKIYFVDSKGLVTLDRGDKLAEHKKFFARRDNNGRQLRDLTDIIDYVQPTALFGLSGIGKSFDEQVLRAMKKVADARQGSGKGRPIIFPLSNPASASECTAEEAWKATDNTAIFASGSPFPPYNQDGTTYNPSQGNNAYIFPALGLSMVLSKSKVLTDGMILASAVALADSMNNKERQENRVYPAIERARDVCISEIAVKVIRKAIEEGVDRLSDDLRKASDDQLRDFVQKQVYVPDYNDTHFKAAL